MNENIPKVMIFIEANTTSNRDFLLGISKFARLHGPWVFYSTPPSYLNNNKKEKVLSRIKEVSASGIITCDTIGIENIIPTHIPMVVVRTLTKPASSGYNIIPNDRAIGSMAAKHLLECGFKNYAYCGYQNMFWSIIREETFTNKIQNSGHKSYSFKLPAKKKSWNKEFRLLCDWLYSLPTPIAIFCCNDDRSRDLMEACKVCNLSVPGKVAILGVDNDQLICEMSRTPLSSIALNSEITGYKSAYLLNNLISGTNSLEENTVFSNNVITEPTHVVTRQSTNIFAINDDDTAEAIRFIRENTSKPINVDNVVDSVSVSRRVLESRFKKYLGRSIYKEIKRYKTDLIAKMLIETDMSVSQIANTLGFPNVNHIARYFQSEKGQTLKDFRKTFSPR